MREIDERFGPLDAEWLGWLWALRCACFTQLPREAVRIVLTEMRMGWACDRCESVCGSVSVAVNRVRRCRGPPWVCLRVCPVLLAIALRA